MKRKKVGTITLAVGLIILGLVLFANNFTDIGIKDIYKYWPVLLIGLGIEMFVFVIIYRRDEAVKLRFDGLCIAFIIAALVFSTNIGWFNFSQRISFNPFQGNMIIDGIKYKGELRETIVKDNISKDFKIDKAIIKNSFGDITLEPYDKDYIKVEANVNIKYNDEQSAREYLENVIKITEGEQTHIYCAEYNSINKNAYGKANVDFVIYVPQGVYADVTNSFGDVNAFGVTKDLIITNQHGDVTAKEIGGSVTVKNSFGDVDIRDIAGQLDVYNQHGDIEADSIKGSVDVETGFGKLAINNVSGKLVAKNNYGIILAKDIKGDAQLKTSFGDIEASNIDGNTIINDNNGSIQAKELKGNVEIRNSFGDISLNSSNVNDADIYAKTSFGDIDTDLPINITKAINDQTASGKLGSGKYRIELISSNGDIEIK